MMQIAPALQDILSSRSGPPPASTLPPNLIQNLLTGGLGGFTSGGAGGLGKGGGISPVPIGGPVKQPMSGQPLGGGMPQGGLPAPTTPGQIPFSQQRMMQAVAGPLQGIGANGNGMGAVNGFGLGGMPPGMALQQQLQGRMPGFPTGAKPGQGSTAASTPPRAIYI